MTFAGLQSGSSVFVDANTLVYHFQPHPVLGPACTDLVERIELQDLVGYTSTAVVSEMAHRQMTLEASALFGWPFAGIAQRLIKHPNQVQSLVRFRQAIQELPQYRIHILTVPGGLLDTAAALCQQHGLLINDSLIVAVMRANGLTQIASNDGDFDRVPGLIRHAPA
jgi:predicted nucleic acid-binding protein